MTEKEKMLKEMLYDANNDEDLLKERTIAKDLCFKFNQLMPSDVENQKKLLKELLGQIDDTASILASFWCDYGYNIKVGKNFFANHNTVIIDCAPVTFGDNVFIAPNCGFYTAGIQLIQNVEIKDLNLLILLRWEIMSGLVQVFK